MNATEFTALRKAKRMTQAEMAALLGKSRKTVVNWENGVFALPGDIVEQLAAHDIVGAVSKASTKADHERDTAERKDAENWLQCYRATRAFYRNHNETMALFNSQGHVIPPAAQVLILEAFPDVLTDPGGDHPVTA